jgi:hypothetical protein
MATPEIQTPSPFIPIARQANQLPVVHYAVILPDQLEGLGLRHLYVEAALDEAAAAALADTSKGRYMGEGKDFFAGMSKYVFNRHDVPQATDILYERVLGDHLVEDFGVTIDLHPLARTQPDIDMRDFKILLARRAIGLA